MTRPGHIANTLSKEGIVDLNDGPNPAFAASPSSPSTRSRPVGFNPGQGFPMWAAGSLTAAKFELKRLEEALGDNPLGASKVSIYATDLRVLIAIIEKLLATQSTEDETQ